MKTQPKQVLWLGDSLDELKAFSDEARRSAGHQLGLIQWGLDPLDWKSMENVGAGVKEIRIRVETSYRVLYVAKFSEAVYVLHAFVKKTPKTSKKDIDLSIDRYKALTKERSSK
jgi:phage-related protein